MIDTDKYEDYTMWIYTEKLDGYFNGEWEDGQTEGQVIKEDAGVTLVGKLRTCTKKNIEKGEE